MTTIPNEHRKLIGRLSIEADLIAGYRVEMRRGAFLCADDLRGTDTLLRDAADALQACADFRAAQAATIAGGEDAPGVGVGEANEVAP